MNDSAGHAAPVEFQDVSKVYAGSVRAVDRVSLSVAAGELVTLLGPSGCGKTTTLRMIAGLEFATEGRIVIGDRDVTALPATMRDVAMVFQSYALFPHMSVRENVAYGLVASGHGKRDATGGAERGLELVGLSGFGDRLPGELSGGQQQRVAVARALVLEPQVLLFDEPLSNLDARLRRQVREDIRELQQRLGLTVVYVTHDQEEALAVSDRIVVMNEARIAQIGTPRDLFERPASEFVADFIGEANLLDATIDSVSDGEATVHVGPLRLLLDARGLSPGPARLAVRPDRFRLVSADPGALAGTVAKASYIGRHMEYRLDTAQGALFVVDPAVERPRSVGDPVGIVCATSGPVLLTG